VKPPPFIYHAPATAEEVDALLAELAPGAKLLAGGQSLLPLLNMRLISPPHVIDVNRVAALPRTPVVEPGAVRVGALVRQAAAERSDEVAAAFPALRTTLRRVAHPAIRSRGTVAGSTAHADPAAELPALLVAAGGRAHARSLRGRRSIDARHLIAGPFESVLEPDEWIEEVEFPVVDGRRFAVDEVARRHGDYALCGVVAAGPAPLELTYFGVGETPVRIALGTAAADGDVDAGAIAAAVAERLDPPTDIHASRELRLRLAERIGVRAARRVMRAAA
jgi:carbon-monoxide dehydrogenase medium subunit